SLVLDRWKNPLFHGFRRHSHPYSVDSHPNWVDRPTRIGGFGAVFVRLRARSDRLLAANHLNFLIFAC
ncbi:hypothetical protein, partial [Mesorhizobium metallidurans]|uniref:hypothetical protein n=1 Tax=Mesorhizobium metallidurans TaxID=489722 RepID=UPI001AE0D6E8